MGTYFFCAYALMLSDVNSLHTLNVKLQQEVFCGNTFYCSGCNRRLMDHFVHLNILLFCCQGIRVQKEKQWFVTSCVLEGSNGSSPD